MPTRRGTPIAAIGPWCPTEPSPSLASWSQGPVSWLLLPSERKQELLEAPTQVEQYMMLYQDLYAHMERTSVLGEIDPSELN